MQRRVREIVEGAGVTKPTLYYYFRSKEGLAKALVSVPLSDLVENLRRIVTTERDPVRCLEQVFEAQFAFCREDPDRSRFVYALIFGPPGSGTATTWNLARKTSVAGPRPPSAGWPMRESFAANAWMRA